MPTIILIEHNYIDRGKIFWELQDWCQHNHLDRGRRFLELPYRFLAENVTKYWYAKVRISLGISPRSSHALKTIWTCKLYAWCTIFLSQVTVCGQFVFSYPIYYRHCVLSLLVYLFNFIIPRMGEKKTQAPTLPRIRLVVTQIRGHIAGSSPPYPLRFVPNIFFCDEISALSSLVDSRRIVLTHARPSQQLIHLKKKSFFANKSKSHHGGIRARWQTLVAFEGLPLVHRVESVTT